MTAIEIRNQIVEGTKYSFPSFRKKGRVYTVSAIIRPIDGNLFIIHGSDLKHAAGLYNEANILTIIETAMNGKQQSSFRLR